MPPTELLIAIVAVAVTVGAVLYLRKQGGPTPQEIRDTLAKGLLLEQQHDMVQAEVYLERALGMLEEAPQPDLSQQVTCLVHLGNIYEQVGKPAEAKKVFDRAIANWAKALQTNKLNPIDIDFAMTNLDFGRGTLDVCAFYVDNIITMRERSLPKGHSDLENSYKIGANLLRKSGYTQEAELLLQRGREGPPPT